MGGGFIRYTHWYRQYFSTFQAYISICDLLIVFGKQTPIKSLLYEPDKSMQLNLVNFLNEKVFVEEEDGELKHVTCASSVMGGGGGGGGGDHE